MTPRCLARIHAACPDLPRPWLESEFTALLEAAGGVVTTRPGGFALGRVVSDEAELLTLAVAPPHRRKGLGRACLREFHAACAAAGAARVFLEVAADNAAARALYANEGYAPVGRRPGYYPGAVDALVMSRALTRGQAPK